MSRWLGAAVLTLACAESPAGTTRAPRFAPEVRAVFATRCDRCHQGSGAAGGWRSDTLSGALGCAWTQGGSDAGVAALLLGALARDDHRDLLGEREREVVTAWARGGAQAPNAGVHPEGVGDPRSTAFHAKTLRASRWALMLDPAAPGSCGRCHDGAPTRPAAVTVGSPGATPCTACHQGARGATSCDTCHQVTGARGAGCSAPQGDRSRDAHAAHLSPRVRAQGLTCESCHPSRDATLARGDHGDGLVQVRLDPALAGEGAGFDRSSGTCTVRCHERGGSTPRPRWRGEGPMTCASCHGAPPAGHPAGACDGCHTEADASGASLRPGPMHLNGTVDLGPAEGGCGGCHGQRGEPWPSTGAHGLHRDTPRARPVACQECHTVPAQTRAAEHLDGVVQVRFGDAARARGARPTWSEGACSAVACHGAGLRAGAPVLRWRDTQASGGCGVCHGVPPAAPHPSDTGCASVLCHGGVVAPSPDGPTISPAGRAMHVDGVVQSGRPP